MALCSTSSQRLSSAFPPTAFFFIYSAPAILASSLFFKHIRHAPSQPLCTCSSLCLQCSSKHFHFLREIGSSHHSLFADFRHITQGGLPRYLISQTHSTCSILLLHLRLSNRSHTLLRSCVYHLYSSTWNVSSMRAEIFC